MKNQWRDEQAAFCDREYPRLVGALTLFVGDRDLAEDLAQDALVQACKHWRRVRTMPAPGAWLHRVAVNQAKSRAARRGRELFATGRLAASRPASESPEPTEALALRVAVASLPERQRLALVLRYYAALPVAEVASIMRCKDGTVKALTHQAVDRLRETSGFPVSGRDLHG